MYSLKQAKIIAAQECMIKKCDIDIYQTGDGIKVKQTSLRNSPDYLIRASYEKGKVIFKENKSKSITPEKKPEKAAPAKESPKAEKAEQKTNLCLQFLRHSSGLAVF